MSEDKSTIAAFSGEVEDFKPWARGFLARAKARGYEQYLLGKKKVPTGTPDSKGDVVFSDAELKKIGQIQKGWSDLMNGIDGKSLEGSDLIGLVLPHGEGEEVPDLEEAWKQVKDFCTPSGRTDRMTVQEDYNRAVLETNEDPKQFISRVKGYREKLEAMGETISERAFVDKILTSLPPIYDMIVSNVNDDQALTVKKLSKKLEARYK